MMLAATGSRMGVALLGFHHGALPGAAAFVVFATAVAYSSFIVKRR
jgi:hypothetical protein